MKKFFSKYIGEILMAIATVICVFFFVHITALVSDYRNSLNKRISDQAEFYALEQSRYIAAQCDDLKRETKFLADKLSATEGGATVSQVKDAFLAEWRNEYLVDIGYYKGDAITDWNGSALSSYAEIRESVNAVGTISRAFQYDNTKMSIAIAENVENSTELDGIVLVFERAAVSIENYKAGDDGEKINSVALAEFSLLIKHDGKIVDRDENTDTFTIGNESVQSGIFATIFSDGAKLQSAVDALTGGKNSSFVFSKNSKYYVLTINSFGSENGNMSLACVYSADKISGESSAMMSSVLSALSGLAVCMVVAVAATFINISASKRREYMSESYNAALNCPTTVKFEKDVEGIMKRHVGANFAIVSLKINNFGYVNEKYGDNAGEELAKYCSAAVRRGLFAEETFAYAGDGEFYLFLHYRDRQAFTERLNGAYLRLRSFDGLGDDYRVNVAFAVYEVEKGVRQSVASMIDKLRMVKKAAAVTVGAFSITFYEDILRENYVRKAEIESRMESALAGNEFHLFYQPKYNLRAKNMDGAEILIRWYDPKIGKYRGPNEFLSVFEEDGFISKLDRFVFFKACENIAGRIAERKICYPVSVNVSRVTAIQPDFVDYYIRIKKKFNIKDGFITLEFTESFAYENYEFLRDIVSKLHENGLLCSIDDFGTGYSSYNILKTIEMDEIKLDKFFLGKGISDDRDKTLLKSVIGMLKKLGAKVTQEGVETRDDMIMLEGFGCDVIQGYYFAKPLKYVDFCEFVDTNFTK